MMNTASTTCEEINAILDDAVAKWITYEDMPLQDSMKT